MLLNRTAEPGTEVAGFLETEDGESSLRVSVRVVHVRQMGTGDYILGARFGRPLTADEMKPFVI